MTEKTHPDTERIDALDELTRLRAENAELRESRYRSSLGMGEFDELFCANAFVHIERMDKRAFWMGITGPDGKDIMVNTGVTNDGIWFFNVDENWKGGERYEIQVPRKPKIDETPIDKFLALKAENAQLRADLERIGRDSKEALEEVKRMIAEFAGSPEGKERVQ